MQDLVAKTVGLRLVPMLAAVKSAIQVVLIFTPGNTGHKLYYITVFLIFLNTFRHGRVNAVAHDKVTLIVRTRTDVPFVLVSGALFFAVSYECHDEPP